MDILVLGAGGGAWGSAHQAGNGIIGGGGIPAGVNAPAGYCNSGGGMSADGVQVNLPTGGNRTISSLSVLSAQGGASSYPSHGCAGSIYYGGSGSSAEDCAAAGYNCYHIEPGGNSGYFYSLYPDEPYYPNTSYGNMNSRASASVTYCGPYADSPCPAD
jgi:hypothetical protein